MASPYDDIMRDALRMARPSRLPWVLLVLAVLAGSATAIFFMYRLDSARKETAASGARALDAQDKLAAMRASKAELESRLEKLEGEKSDLVALKNELSRSIQSKDEELSKLKGTFDELREKMKAEITKGEIRLSQTNGRLKVDMVDKILFESGEAEISKGGEEVLSRVGAVLARLEGKQIQVAGHTDDSPISTRLADRYPTNWELSATRATNVVRFLEEKARVPGQRLVSSGYGPFHPIATNSTPSGRARNRRIEILLTPSLDPTPSKLELAKAEPSKSAVAKPEATKAKVAPSAKTKKR
jgi:chemotaxis protein MotB